MISNISEKVITNKSIENTFDELFEKIKSLNREKDFYYKIGYASIVRQFSNYQPENITWIDICNSVQINKAHKLHIIFLVQLLENNQIKCEYAKYLYKLLPTFKNLMGYPGYPWHLVFCRENISKFRIVINKYEEYKVPCLNNENYNVYVRELLISFLNEYDYFSRSNDDNIALLEASLGNNISRIYSYSYFNDNTFWSQVKYVQTYFKNNKKLSKAAIKLVIAFYRYLLKTYTEHNFFKDSLSMSYHVLFSSMLLFLINNDYYITAFNPLNRIYDKEKIFFLINGYNKASTMLKKEDSFRVDLSRISSDKFRRDILDFLYSSPNVTKFTRQDKLNNIIDIIDVLIKVKKEPNYPNPDFNYINNQEVNFIKEYINSKKVMLSTKNNRIYHIKDFLEWENKMNRMKFDDSVFEYLEQFAKPIAGNSKAISDNELIDLNNLILQKSNDNHIISIYHSLFHLLIQTEFRINQILHLEINCIKPTVKPNQYIIQSISKTSRGTVSEYVITEYTYKILIEAINESNKLRVNCQSENLRNYIFLYEGVDKVVRLITLDKFSKFIKMCCKELGWEYHYTASNLRDTHMTKGFENELRKGKGNLNLSIISGHKRIDTTINHYIDFKLDEMLESTFGIEIGNSKLIDTSGKVVNLTQNNVLENRNTVENGCGFCKKSQCINPSILPCLVCEHFITTIEHEIYFKKAIEVIDAQIYQSKIEHDIEDLNIIKKLHVLYLKEIYKVKENEEHD